MNLTQLLLNENPVIINILAVMFSISEALLFSNLISIFMKITPTIKQKTIFVLVMIITNTITIFFPNSLIEDILNILTFALSMKLLFHLNVKNTFISIILSYLSIMVCEYISESIFMYILHKPFIEIATIPLYYFMAIIFAFFLLHLVIVLFKYILKEKSKILRLVHIPIKASIITNLILGIFTMALEAYLFSTHMDSIDFTLRAIILISLLIYFSISMYSLVRTNTLEKTEADLENEKVYNKTLTLLHDNIRGFKHDFNNIVQAIGGYIALNDMDGLADYYNRLLDECKLTNNLNLLNPETINNPSIYSLLTNKYYLANEKGITMTFSIFTDLSKINFNMYEFSRILGILLDNAIEAAEESTEKIVHIEFTSDDKKQLFIIKNSCKDTNISTTKIFEKGYSTKSENSGFGLWKVHKILSKNTNLDLFTTISDNMFSQQLAVFY